MPDSRSPCIRGVPSGFPRVLSMRERAEVMNSVLSDRLETILPEAMRRAGLDMWLVLCQEDNPDPVLGTLIPMDTWCPILTALVFHDCGEALGLECINLSGVNTHDLYDRPYRGQQEQEQWPLLLKIIEDRNPHSIGINVGQVQWAAGGLTHNLHRQLCSRLPDRFVQRLSSAEALVEYWLACLSDTELMLYEHVVSVARALIAECYSRSTIVPGATTTRDLEWHYWERVAELGLEVAFKPYFNLIRSEEAAARFGPEDQVIRAGDVIHCDVGIKYLRLNSDHQQLAYVLRAGETAAPPGLRSLLAEANRLQEVFQAEFSRGLTGNELLARILDRAVAAGIPTPKVYSHSLGHMLHEPGPLIGLPWQQSAIAGRGEVRLEHNYAFTMELSVAARVPEWGPSAHVRLPLEEDVVFTSEGCQLIGGRQEEFLLV